MAMRRLGTDWQKELLETVPCLIVVFRVAYGIRHDDGLCSVAVCA